MVTFYRDSERGIMLDWIKNFTRTIPEKFVKIKKELDELKIFDNYVIMHYDPNGKSSKMTDEEELENPILRLKKHIEFAECQNPEPEECQNPESAEYHVEQLVALAADIVVKDTMSLSDRFTYDKDIFDWPVNDDVPPLRPTSPEWHPFTERRTAPPLPPRPHRSPPPPTPPPPPPCI